MRSWRILAIILLALGVWSSATAQGIRQASRDGVRMVYFDPFGAHIVDYATRCLLDALAAQDRLFGYRPEGEIPVLLRDFADRGNATTILGAPRNRIFFDIAPPSLAFETFSPAERMFTIMNHELVHVAMGDRPNSVDLRYRRLFSGKVGPVAEHPESILYYYLTNPRGTSPRWYMEGAAVFLETWMAGGLGRAQGGYDEMVFRAMVRDDAEFFTPLSLESKGSDVDFQAGANAYLYGTRFLSYLALQYGPEKLLAWWRRDEGSERYYATEFKQVYGRSLDTAWREWIDWEREFQQANLSAVRAYPTTETRDIAKEGLGAISQAHVSADGRELYAAVRYPGRVSAVTAMDLTTGSVRELAEVTGAIPLRVSSLAYDPAGKGTLFYTTDNQNFRHLNALDLGTGQSRQLLASARIGDLAFDRSDRSLWGLRYNNGYVILVNIPYPYSTWNQVHIFPYAESVFDLDVSRDGKMLSFSVAGPGLQPGDPQRMTVRVLERARLLAGDATPLREFDSGTAVPESFVFSPDGRYLYGSSFYTGVSNIFRFEIATGGIEAMSNAEIGFFRPVPVGDNRLLAFRYTTQGFVPIELPLRTYPDVSAIRFLGERIASEHPVVQSWAMPSPPVVSVNPAENAHREYDPLKELTLEAAYPVIEGYKDAIAPGFHVRLSDPIGFDTVNFTLGYSPDNSLPVKERAHLAADFRHGMWRAALKWNAGDFYDLAGPTKRAREGYSLRLDYDRPLIYMPPRTLNLVGSLAWYGGLDALPEFQNIAAPDKLLSASLGFRSRNPRASVGSVDEEQGVLWSLQGRLSAASGEVVPGVVGQWDVGRQLPWRHASVWWRNAGAVSWGTRDNPIANNYLGGFGNNYLDNGEVKRYRASYAMPGFGLNSLGGKSYVKTMVELNLPPIRFESLGKAGFFANYLRPAVFAGAVATDPTASRYREIGYNLGAQFDLQMSVAHRLPMTLSFGVARGFQGGGAGETEWMISLKVL